MNTLEQVKQNIDDYCDEKKLGHRIIIHNEYDEYIFTTYDGQNIQDLKNLIEDKGVVHENYDNIGDNNIRRELKVFITKTF